MGAVDNPLYGKGVYFLRGPFFPKNRPNTSFDSLAFEGHDHPFVGTRLSYMGSFTDSVAVTSTGIVCNIDTVQESSPKSPEDILLTTIDTTKLLTVLHSDFHPIVNTICPVTAISRTTAVSPSSDPETHNTQTRRRSNRIPTYSQSERSTPTMKSTPSSTFCPLAFQVEDWGKRPVFSSPIVRSSSNKRRRLNSM
ncbi:uncharacterized protein MELLADRAFT_105270 [Melampsora larici-populina 98AG31]|uniref:Uncharacterized protein n=1 Tax=Melampsora larici-populina (strain 98AG31 / pathotype 3-4-7) TaxID=747676 RepID=F4RHJ9_MELLP|nr:uncharacterized protein MELLADRAFT_105270 [Melampsora larici-populina 98AG31]EGG08250.1 hypothetical protein MELLADRAFT_105270 [Melampsora larici-populina 98AG31]